MVDATTAMRVLLKFLVSFGLVVAAGAQHEMRFPNRYYLPEEWPQHRIQLTEKGELSELFQAGLRPEYRGETDKKTLTIKHARLGFVLPEGDVLPEFAVEYSAIDVLKSGLLLMEFVSQPLSVEDARFEMEKWLPFFRESHRKTSEELARFLKLVEEDYSGFDDPNFGGAPEGFGGGFTASNRVGYGVRFQKAYNEVLPVRIYLRVSWYRIRSEREQRAWFRSEVPPPRGFQIGIATNSGPDSTSEMMYAKGITFPAGRGLGGVPSNVIERSEEPSRRRVRGRDDGEREINEPSQSKDKRVFWWVSGILLGLLMIGIFKWRRFKQGVGG